MDYPNYPTYLFACAPPLERLALSIITTSPRPLGGTFETLIKPLFELAYPTWGNLRYDTFLASYDITRLVVTIDGVEVALIYIGVVWAAQLNSSLDTNIINLLSPYPRIVTGF